MTPKGGKSTDHNHNLIGSEGAQDTSTCKISDHSLHAFSGKYPETSPNGRTDGRTCRKTVTVGRMDQRNHVQVKRGYFRLWTDGQTDGQPKNIMPPAPKGGGIKSERTDGQTNECPEGIPMPPPSKLGTGKGVVKNENLKMSKNRFLWHCNTDLWLMTLKS